MSSIFDILPPPADRVKAMLMADLAIRCNDPRTHRRFNFANGYRYAGGAGLVLAHGEFWPGRQLPAAYSGLVGQPTHCFTNSLYACEHAIMLDYVEGYCTTGDGTAFLHGWCVDKDGVVELTLPTDPEQLAMVHRPSYTGKGRLPLLPPERWGYYGVRFATSLVRDHGDSLNPLAGPNDEPTRGLPMLDRSNAEVAEPTDPGLDMSEPHDFPVLKLLYDPNRKALP